MVRYPACRDIWHQQVTALRISAIVISRASNDASVLLYVYFFAWVLEPKPAAWNCRDHVAFIVYSGEIGDLGVKVRRPGRVANPRRPERDASDRGSLREVKLHEERIELGERSTERVTDEDDVGRRVLDHQTLHLCEDLTRRLPVLECEARVDPDVAENVGEEGGVGLHEFKDHVR